MRNKVQQSKNEHVKQLEQLGRLTGELAHEIKNPLSTIKINLKLAREQLQDLHPADCRSTRGAGPNQPFDRALRKIAIIEKETDRLEQILNGFLRYVTEPELQLANANVTTVVGDMIDFYLPQAQSHSIIIRQQLSDKPLICKLDADMLKQAILNLFINAQQAMKQGGELMVRTEQRDNHAVIQISDTGHGIAADKIPHIFTPYYSSRSDGTGLGLPTAKKIIEAHHGTITVDSELGKGTSFTINLPLQKL